MEYNSMEISNPYAVQSAAPMSMDAQSGHSAGNSLAANAEARAIAEVKAQVMMAKMYPRDPAAAVDSILRECARPTLADSAVYTFPRGKETVTGPSIRLAEVMARCWGNCSFGQTVLERGKDDKGIGYSVVEAYAWDQETNLRVSRQFEVKHFRSTKSGGYAITDDRDIYELEANMGARRLRACILQMIPGDVTQAAVNACRKTASSGLVEAMADARQREQLIVKTIKVFEKMGISAADIEEYLKVRKDDWTADEMLKLKELKTSLEDNVLSIGEVFPHLGATEKNTVISKEQVKELMALAAATGKQGDIGDRLKAIGISRYADVPVTRFEEVKAMIASFSEKTLTEPVNENESVSEAVEQNG